MTLPRLLRRFALHQLVSLLTVGFCMVVLSGIFEAIGSAPYWFLLVASGCAMLGGLALPFEIRNTPRAAFWTWVLPFALLLWAFSSDVRFEGLSKARFEYFGTLIRNPTMEEQSNSGEGQLAEVFFTVPCLLSIMYALGAFWAGQTERGLAAINADIWAPDIQGLQLVDCSDRAEDR